MIKFCSIIILILLFNLTSNAQTDDKILNKIGAFNAKIKGGEVELVWKIINPGKLYKFKIESKKSGTELYNSLTDVLFANFRKKEESDSLVSYYYAYSDKPQENGVYFYKITVYDISNKIVTEEEIKLGITEVPEFKLQQNNPNPFNPSTVISYTLLVPTTVKLKVYSLTGQAVDLLVDGFQTPGTYSINFNASKYSEMSSGIYFYKLETNYTSDIKKMIFTK
ncbi:MAG: T9SS type A sorting domain-containing protein [Bacteroidota bacterium]|nr:T9SS type A sorting domain-containing protein [Bacteroidota bacterium]